MIDFEREPDFVNEIGTKWWLHESLTDYAHKKNLKGIGLPDHRVYYVETADKSRELILLHKDKIVHGTRSLEAMACFIDVQKILAGDD